MNKLTNFVQNKYQDLKMATKPEPDPDLQEDDITLPVPIGDIDLEAKGKQLGIKYFLVSYCPLNADNRVSIIPRRAIREVQRNGCGVPSAMFFKADGADPEMYIVPDPKTLVQLPWKPEYAWLSSDLYMHGKPFSQCPRRCLKRNIKKARDLGFVMKSGIEPEFNILNADGTELADLQDVRQPMSLQCPSSTLKMSPILMKIYDVMEKLGWEPYEVDHEASCCQYEINFGYTDALTTADRHAFMKFMMKEIAIMEGYRITFMPVPSKKLLCANGLHLNVSLWNASDDTNAFTDAEPSGLGITPSCRYFIGGLLQHAKASCAVMCPTVNSYKRLAGGSWCPNTINWGGNNRTVLIRVPANNRVEHRLADGSCNPYLLQAAVLAAGLDGIELQIDPPEEVDYLATDFPEKFDRMPRTLKDAMNELESDVMMVKSLGADLVSAFCMLKEREWSQYTEQLTDWETDFYMNC